MPRHTETTSGSELAGRLGLHRVGRERGGVNLSPNYLRSRRDCIDFSAVNAAALRELPRVLARWLPEGRLQGSEFVARNPRRADRRPGSFRVNIRTGRWADFATADSGGDPVSLAAFLFGLSQLEAARGLAAMLGLAREGGRRG